MDNSQIYQRAKCVSVTTNCLSWMAMMMISTTFKRDFAAHFTRPFQFGCDSATQRTVWQSALPHSKTKTHSKMFNAKQINRLSYSFDRGAWKY